MHRAGRLSLGARLLAAAALVREGGVAADIGCDHGKLAVYLACSGHCQKVIAVDSKPRPLAKARALAEQTGCAGKVECRLGNGLGALKPNEAGDIVIAGLSGETMIEILAGCPWAKSDALRFVLVPASRGERLRRWLCTAGFAMIAETPVCEKGRYYTAMHCRYTGQSQVCTDVFAVLGRVPETKNDAARGYIGARLRWLQQLADTPLDGGQRERLEKLMEEVRAWLP